MLFLSVALVGVIESAAQARQYRALLVGVSRYSPFYNVSPLDSSVNDATGLYETLLADETRWSELQIEVLLDEQARRDAIRLRLRRMAALCGPGDVFVYYQASHGGQSQGLDTYLCTYDGPYTDRELGDDLALFNPATSVVVMVEACNSAGLFKDAAARPVLGEWPFGDNALSRCQAVRSAASVKNDAAAKVWTDHIAFITSSDYDRLSYASRPHGVFTGYLLAAFANPAVDVDGDGQYSFWELYQNAAGRTAAATVVQIAQHFNQPLLEAVAAAAIPGGKYALAAAQQDDEFEPNNDRDTAAALAPTSYSLVARDDDWFRFAHPGGLLLVRTAARNVNLDLFLYQTDGGEAAASATPGSSDEMIEISLPAGDYDVLVRSEGGGTGRYALAVQTPKSGVGLPAAGCGALGSVPLAAGVMAALAAGRTTAYRRNGGTR